MAPKKQDGAMHLEAHTKSVKRALRAADHAFEDVDVHRSEAAAGEHGKTTVTYKHALDATEHALAQNRVSKQAALEEDLLLREDDDTEEGSA